MQSPSSQHSVIKDNEETGNSPKKARSEARKNARLARIAAMHPLRRALWNLLALGWLPGVMLAAPMGWALSAFVILLSLSTIFSPMIDPHPKKIRRVLLGVLVAPVVVAMTCAAYQKNMPSEEGLLSRKHIAHVREESANLTANLGAFEEDAQEMLESFTQGRLTVALDTDFGGSFKDYTAQGRALDWTVRNDVLAARAIDWLMRYMSEGVAPYYDARFVMGGHVLLADRVVTFIDREGMTADNLAIRTEVKETFGKDLWDLPPENVWPIEDRISGDHLLNCVYRDGEVIYAYAIGRSSGFDLEAIPGAAPMLRVCEVAGTLPDLSHLPRFGDTRKAP